MSLSPYNLERTRAPRRTIPRWVYAGAVLLVALVILAVVRALPGNEVTPESGAPEPTMEASSPSSPTPAAEPLPINSTRLDDSRTAATEPSAQIPASATSGTDALDEARRVLDEGDYQQSRELALQVWEQSPDEGLKRNAEEILNKASIGLALSPRAMPEKEEYTVQSGDSLDKIAKKFGTTIELIRAGNNIRGHLIRAGDRLRVLTGEFRVSVSKSENDLVVYLNNRFFKRYRVGTGQYNKTPVGDFLINDRISQPTWWRPDGKAVPYGDPENLLGTHWLSIDIKGYGLHGTWEPDTIGKQASAGCVRMLNEDIEQLFTLLPIGTPVSIRD